MRSIRGLLTGIVLLTNLATVVHARTSSPVCNDIRRAINAGATIEQVMREFGVDEAGVVKCLQAKKRKGKSKKAKKSPANSATTGHDASAHVPTAGSAKASQHPSTAH